MSYSVGLLKIIYRMFAGGESIIFSNGVATGKIHIKKEEVMEKRYGTPECNGSKYVYMKLSKIKEINRNSNMC